MINVAVSRAKNRLILVTNSNVIDKPSNVKDLVDYIEYNNFEVRKSNINSVFDLLYENLKMQREEYLKNIDYISEFDSLNLMYKIIKEVIRDSNLNFLNVLSHYPLGKLLRNNNLLSDEERSYAFHPNTHLDFIIYNKLSKLIVLTVEVDGHTYHKKGTVQHERDIKKGRILKKYNIPLLRLNTTGSNEKEKLINKLNYLLK